MILPWANMEIYFVTRLSSVHVFNIQTQSLENKDIARDIFKNVLEYVYLKKKTIVITKFPELIQNMLNEGLTLNLLTIQKEKNWRSHHINSFENCAK